MGIHHHSPSEPMKKICKSINGGSFVLYEPKEAYKDGEKRKEARTSYSNDGR
jgi:hypothetical protein